MAHPYRRSGYRSAQAASDTIPLLADVSKPCRSRKRKPTNRPPTNEQPGEYQKPILQLHFGQEYYSLKGQTPLRTKEGIGKSQRAGVTLEQENVRKDWMRRLRPMAHRR
ncbi:hypothetical protein N7478_003720 [Penicillium angulare]|uniref:uncharacterized protein n=1 Tax=Penicillium angulare TaxID=116970 RepID=UPI00253FBC3F|nr:uncharacterized protein N7478_003720 [Penicillium angulare]KAJ5288034.1 hypothetical protein N7478_003720 [Penicillium angulare]